MMKKIKTTENREYTIEKSGIKVEFESFGRHYTRALWIATTGQKFVKFEGAFYRIDESYNGYKIGARPEFSI